MSNAAIQIVLIKPLKFMIIKRSQITKKKAFNWTAGMKILSSISCPKTTMVGREIQSSSICPR